MFWTSDIKELFKENLILNNNMTDDEKLNTVMRFILFTGIIIALLFNQYNILLVILLILLSSILLFYYQKNLKKNNESFLDKKNLKIINNEICIGPTKNNPLMNKNIFDKSDYYNNYNSCLNSNKNIDNEITDILNNSMNIDYYNIYGKNNLNLILYTMPNTNLPNDQDIFAKWLYKDYNPCKSNGGNACFE